MAIEQAFSIIFATGLGTTVFLLLARPRPRMATSMADAVPFGPLQTTQPTPMIPSGVETSTPSATVPRASTSPAAVAAIRRSEPFSMAASFTTGTASAEEASAIVQQLAEQSDSGQPTHRTRGRNGAGSRHNKSTKVPAKNEFPLQAVGSG